MIGTIRKHSKVLWWVVIVAIIITFVWWGSNAPQTDGSSAGAGNYGTMNGKVITPAVFNDAQREVALYHFFATGSFPGGERTIPNFDIERETFNRLLVIQKLDELGIHASDDAVAKAANERLRMINQGNPVPLAAFETEVLSRARLTLADFERFIRNELGIQQLIAVVGAGGDLATPQEVEALYRRDYQELVAQVIFFAATNHHDAVEVTPEKLGAFYTNQLARYRLPERLQVSYVSIPFSNYHAQAKEFFDQLTNLNELVEARYLQLGTNYFAETDTPESAMTKIREGFFKSRLVELAEAEAVKIDNVLYDKMPANPEAFAALVKELGHTAQVTAPFSRDEAPAGLDVGPEFSRQAFRLTVEEPFTTPIAGENHFYVITLNQRVPSANPPFEDVKERVTQDFRFMESAMKARQQAMDFYATVTGTNGLAGGKSFADLCAAAKLKPVTLKPFALSTRTIPELEGRVEQNEFKRAAFAVGPGQVTQLLPSPDGAVLGYVSARLPLDETAMRTNLPAFTRSVQQVRRSEVFNEWFRTEATRAYRTIPYFQAQQAQMSGAGGQPGAAQPGAGQP
jgi:parvulin-like peptidyl-prolyl isomerase